jgi:rhodanese-related sulfurtransferase
MEIKTSKIVEYVIGIVIIGFWLFMIVLGIVNQFNIAFIESEDFYTFIESQHPIIIDLRESTEIENMPLDYKQTIHLPFLFLESRINEVNIPQNGPILLVCSDGNRSRLIATLLQKEGVKSYYLRSGLEGVEDTGRQVTK